MWNIRDPLTWASSFMVFVATRSDNQETRDMPAYDQLVLLLTRKHGGLGWVAYDHQFRQQAAAGSAALWSELNQYRLWPPQFSPLVVRLPLGHTRSALQLIMQPVSVP